jgi:RNA-directed DNA polymerase
MDINNSILYKCCETSVTRQSNILRICLFDRDDRTFMKKCREGDSLYKDWGNRLYSCVLPQPEHRDFSEVCIEHFYSDEVLRTKSPKGRRIYLSNEFDPGTGKHLSEDLTCRKRTDASCCYPKIIDSGVFKPNGDNVALSKNDFANLIFNREGDFADISFEHFRPVFELLSEIIEKDGALKEKLRASSSA